MKLSYLHTQKTPKRVAVIDLGTNTFNIIIAEEDNRLFFRNIYDEKVLVRIGQNGISEQKIDKDAQIRAIEALKHYKHKLSLYQVNMKDTLAIATSAFRNAKNAIELVQKVKEECEIDIHIISGKKEATYIYKGIKANIPLTQETYLMMDIGGGSVEFIIANKNQVFWKQSYEVGAQRLLDKFMKTDPIGVLGLSMLEIYLEAELFTLNQAIFQFAPKYFVGASGAFETLEEIEKANFYEEEIYHNDFIRTLSQKSVERDNFYQIFYELTRKNQEERLAMPGMNPIRADMMVVAMGLLKFVLDKWRFDEILISEYSLREGVLMDLLS